MKREEVKAIFPDATDEQLDKIMAKNGEDINKAKGDLDKIKGELDKAKTDLAAANQGDALKEAQEQAEKYKNELDGLKLANSLREMREKVAKEKNIPAALLTADTEEGCTAQAESILAFSKSQNPTGYPKIPDGGSVGAGTSSTRQKFAEWAKDQL